MALNHGFMGLIVSSLSCPLLLYYKYITLASKMHAYTQYKSATKIAKNCPKSWKLKITPPAHFHPNKPLISIPEIIRRSSKPFSRRATLQNLRSTHHRTWVKFEFKTFHTRNINHFISYIHVIIVICECSNVPHVFERALIMDHHYQWFLNSDLRISLYRNFQIK